MQAAHSHRSLKERQRQEREQLILQAAEDGFIEKDYFETSMDEIAARVGIGKGTVYLHFPSKEDLIGAIFTRDAEKFLQAVDEAILTDPPLSARAKLEAVLYFMYNGFYSKRSQLLSSIYHSADLRRFFMEKNGRLRGLWEHLAEHIKQILEEGKAAGDFDQHIPTNVMISAFFSLQSLRSYEHLIIGEQMPPEELAKYLGQFFFKGIAAVE